MASYGSNETAVTIRTLVRDFRGPVASPPVSIQGHGIDAVRAGGVFGLPDTLVEFLGHPTQLTLRIRSGTACGRCQPEQLFAGAVPGRHQVERNCGSSGTLPQLARESRCGLSERHTVEDRLTPFLDLFQLLPPLLLAIRGPCGTAVPEHMRMPAHQ